MSSIAYVSDEKMLDLHRKNGNRSINFWRLSRKKFDRFAKGDLVFFLDKRQLQPITKEKGLIGYGRLKEIDSIGLKTMWERYGIETGYPSYESLLESVSSSADEASIKGKMQSLVIEDVIFFNSPIFLSELGFNLNRNLESFTYLENEGKDLAIDILKKAQLDPWFQVLTQLPENALEQDIHQQKIREVLSAINIPWNDTQLAITKDFKTVSAIAYEITETIKIIIPITNIKKQRYALYGISAIIRKQIEEPCLIEAWIKNDYQEYLEEFKALDIVPVNI